MVLVLVLLGGCAVRRKLDFFRSTQVQLLAVIAAVVLVNWYLVGRIDPPFYLAGLDQSTSLLQRAIFQLVFVILCVAFIRTPHQLALVTVFFVCTVLLTAATAVSPALETASRAAAGTFGIYDARNSNRLAFFCLLVIPLIWFRMMASRSRLGRLAGSTGILGLGLTVLLSGSRSGLLNLVLLPGLLTAHSHQKRRHGMAILVVTLLAIGLLPALVPQRILNRLATVTLTDSTGEAAGSVDKRWQVFSQGLKLFWQSPFLGVGVGNFRWLAAMDPSYGEVLGTHNAYLLALVEGGLILLAAHVLLLWQTNRDLGKTANRALAAPQLGLHWLVVATRANIWLLAIFSLFAEVWKEGIFPLLIATAAVLHTDIETPPNSAAPPNGREPSPDRVHHPPPVRASPGESGVPVMTRLAYLLGTFPALTETFILGEIEALRDVGVEADLFALRRPRALFTGRVGRPGAAEGRNGGGSSPCPAKGNPARFSSPST